MTIANSLQTMQKAGEANIYYEQVLQIDPDNAVALNNLAWQIREEDPDKALEYAMHASRIAPDSADVLDTLAVIEYINKDYKQAGRSIERALRQSPDHPSLLYHSAMISAATGDSAQAIDILDDLLAEDTDFPEIEQANGLLLELRK
jgi:tetratricopeptide (TPR) repeat protein